MSYSKKPYIVNVDNEQGVTSVQITVRRICALFLWTLLIGVSLPIMQFGSAQYYSYSQCTVTATTNMPGAGYITPGSGNYNYGDYVVFTEYTFKGYQFDGWYLNGVYEGQLNSIPLTITQDYQLQAIFSKSAVELTITESPQGGEHWRRAQVSGTTPTAML